MGEVLTESLMALLNVALVGVLLGAGVPAIFAFGMKALGMGRTVTADGADFVEPVTSAGRAVSVLCFGLAMLAVLFGIVVIIFGKQLFG